MGRVTTWSFLGRVPYGEAVALQEANRAALRRRAVARVGGVAEDGGPDETGSGSETLLLLEHPHVYTLGRNAAAGDVLAPAAWLASAGVEVAECDRGGQVTYHGPGQLVGYPILDLAPDRRDVRRYVRDLSEVLIRTLGDFGVAATPGEDQARIGVWAAGQKVASLGVHLSRWITTHGFALNVTTELSYFDRIVPCGLPGVRMASIASLTGARPSLEEVAARVVIHFGDVFDRAMRHGPPPLARVAADTAAPSAGPAAAPEPLLEGGGLRAELSGLAVPPLG